MKQNAIQGEGLLAKAIRLRENAELYAQNSTNAAAKTTKEDRRTITSNEKPPAQNLSNPGLRRPARKPQVMFNTELAESLARQAKIFYEQPSSPTPTPALRQNSDQDNLKNGFLYFYDVFRRTAAEYPVSTALVSACVGALAYELVVNATYLKNKI
jgi:hypothetical protein